MRRRIETILILLIAVALLTATHLYITFYTPASRQGELKTVNISRGTSFRAVATELENAGIVRDSDSFIFIASILGAYKKVKAGEYEFNSSMTPIEILESLVKGRVKRHLLTIPEGYNITDIANALAYEGLVDAGKFIARASDRAFAASEGIDGASFEGYLFPDTYEFTRGMTNDEIIRRMAGKFKEVYALEFDRLARSKGMSMKKVVTLASIIEKETGAPGERALISAIFHNRLKKGIRLQSDPTVIYGINGFNGNITKKDLLSKTPYNTYVNYGLPPGPIANPGRESIRAALSPAAEDYLYFVSKNDGTHFFSRSLKEHNNAVNQFQRQMRAVEAGKRG